MALGRFDGSVALVVGGTSGIGAATAQRLIDEGADVVVAGRDGDRGSATARRLGDSCRFVAADAIRRDEVDALVGDVEGRHGRLDVLVNAAGAVAVRPFATMSAERWEQGGKNKRRSPGARASRSSSPGRVSDQGSVGSDR